MRILLWWTFLLAAVPDVFMFFYSKQVFAGVGERTREGNDLYNEMKVGGVITDDYKTSKV